MTATVAGSFWKVRWPELCQLSVSREGGDALSLLPATQLPLLKMVILNQSCLPGPCKVLLALVISRLLSACSWDTFPFLKNMHLWNLCYMPCTVLDTLMHATFLLNACKGIELSAIKTQTVKRYSLQPSETHHLQI